MENKILTEIFPKDLAGISLGGSSWQSRETEIISQNIIFIQNKINPDKWTPFSWEDYKRLCEHNVTNSEGLVLRALVEGGAPVAFTTCYLSPGYLVKDELGRYCITEKFLEVVIKMKK